MSNTAADKEISSWESVKMLFGASKGFWLVNMVNFGDGISYFGILTLLTLFLGKERLGMSDHLAGVTVSMFTGLVTLFMFGGGFISDRLGVRRALTLCLSLLLAGRILLSGSPSFGGAAVAWMALLILSLGEGVIQPALYAGVKEYTDSRTATMGYGILYAIMNLGIVAENFISPFVRTNTAFVGGIRGLGLGFDGVFWMCTGITAIMLLVHLGFFTRKVEQTDRVMVDAAEPEGPVKTFREKMLELPFLDSRFMFFIFILLPVRTLFAHQFLTMPDYVFRAYPPEVGAKFEWIAGLNPLIIVIFVPLIAAMTRKANIVTMMIIGTAISALTTFILVPGPDLTRLLFYVLLFSLGEAVWSSRFLEYVANMAPAGRVGAYMGLAGIPWFLAKFTTGLYSGRMLEIFVPKGGVLDTSTLWLIYGVIACISPVGLLLARPWLLGHKKA
ncbi:MAG TPA: MFS transporter [Elusimicrobia bacterium]|nr:MFS transporter [Elusimicrobiota bacterium]HBT61041.1 MFS transporter [Elusimicrobiota bacterium]